MKKTRLNLSIFLVIFVLISASVHAQTDTFGVWKADPSIALTYSDVRGSMVIVKWQQFQMGPTTFNWTSFDNALKSNTIGSTVLLVWIWSVNTNVFPPSFMFKPPLGTGTLDTVPLKNCTGSNCSGTCTVDPTVKAPPFYSAEFKSYFKIMIDSVKRRINNVLTGVVSVNATTLQAYQRIVAIQACLGSTGDYPSYKGYCADTAVDFDAYFYEMSHYYDSVYKNNAQGIHVLHNPGNSNFPQIEWVLGKSNSYPAPTKPWLKMGDVGHGYQLYGEKNYYATITSNGIFSLKNGQYIRSRSEMATDVTTSGWWKAPGVGDPGYPDPGRPYRNMLALLGSAAHFGLDMSNQIGELSDGTSGNNPYKNAFDFYNRHAGKKDASTATYGFCMLRDGLDASDIVRFPEGGEYGHYYTSGHSDSMYARFRKIQSHFAANGAVLQDTVAAIGGSLANRGANGINDVGDSIITTNYERYLKQILPNFDLDGDGNRDSLYKTCDGYWNVKNSGNQNAVYGRYAKGIINKYGRRALYFDIDNAFVNSADSIRIYVTYLDSVASPNSNGRDFWRLKYKDSSGTNLSRTVYKDLSNTHTWKTDSVTIKASWFQNKNSFVSDFFIDTYDTDSGATKMQPDIFALIEIRKIPATPGVAQAKSTVKTESVVMIYPNPAADRFIVTNRDKKPMEMISIYTQSGVLVMQKKINTVFANVSRSEIGNRAGTYFINVTIDGVVHIKELKVL